MSTPWKHFSFQMVLLTSFRLINSKTPGPMPSPLVPISPLPTDVRRVALKGESHRAAEKVELLNPVNLSLECTWSVDVNKLPNITGYWRKDGQEIETVQLTVQQQDDKYILRREFRIVSEENFGCYSCSFGNDVQADFILAGPQIGDVRDKPIVSYTGDSVVIPCKMDENKPKPISWNWYKANGTDKDLILIDAQPQRYEIKIKEGGTKLVVHKLIQADSGLYYCEAVYPISTTKGNVELKVMTLWEPLKPFIAILVEVVVLVTAILLFEKTQSKKSSPEGNDTTADPANILTQEDANGPEENSSTRKRQV